MKREFAEYLAQLGMPQTLRDRVEAVLQFYEHAGFSDVTGLFVNDYLNQEGTRQFENLILFTDSHVLEAKGFVSQDDFDAAPWKKHVGYVQIRRQEYDFSESWNQNSRLSITVLLRTEIPAASSVIFMAARKNCDYLRDIWRQFILPNMTA